MEILYDYKFIKINKFRDLKQLKLVENNFFFFEMVDKKVHKFNGIIY
jgi:hypothetical protein